MTLLSKKGLTAIELVIGIGLVAMLTTIMVSTQLFLTKDQIDLRAKLDDSIDTNLAERALFMDFSAIDPSYNNMLVRDDYNNSFFDYYPDVPANVLTGRLDRVATLTSKGLRKEFYAIIQDTKAGPMVNYDPVAAYDVGPPPADFNKSALLTYRGLNRNGWVKNLYKDFNPEFWLNGRLILLDTPARLRPMDASGNVDMLVAPRSPLFIGSIRANSLVVDGTITSLVNLTNPTDGATISAVDAFLRRAPSIGGGQSIVRMRPVHLVKYYLVSQEDASTAESMSFLYRTTYRDGKWGQPFLLADRVSEFSIRRDSVLKRMIYFKVKKVERKRVMETVGL